MRSLHNWIKYNMIWIEIAVLCLTTALQGAITTNTDWCYHDTTCNEVTWVTDDSKCSTGTRQSPIDIVSTKATYDSNLNPFTFTNFNNQKALATIKNTGHTVKVTLASGVSVSGGGLPVKYDTLELHLHWGNGASVPGSEHTIDQKRFPMELHIVSIKSSYNGSLDAAVADSTGVAVLGFFVEAEDTTGQPKSWKTLTSLLANIIQKNQYADITLLGLSLDDLLPGVDRSRFYRYLGSLTTPRCHEAVVWTVFKEPVKVSKDLIELFSSTVRVGNSTSAYMVNTYRSLQPEQKVTHSSSAKTSCSSGLVLFVLTLWMS